MYFALLFIHSILRWLILISLLSAIFISFRGWFQKRTYTKTDNVLRVATMTLAHLQLVFGLCLYFISPLIKFFFSNFKSAVKVKDVRFFGMEHSVIMIIAIIIITIGSIMTKRKTNDTDKFKTLAIWFTVALIIIFISIPWPFLSFVSNRPYFR